MSSDHQVCVVHLVWVPLGIEPFKRFLKSYSTVRAGMDHDLLIVFNGHESERELTVYEEMLQGYRCLLLEIQKPGLDIRSYFIVMKKFRYRYFCFLNSYSRLLEQDWLLKLFSNASRQGVGLVGATGSYESFYTNFVEGLERIDESNLFRRVSRRLKQTVKLLKKQHRFDPFPNYHIRTNGFMISREVMRRIHPGLIRRKTHAYMFESGKSSMTKQVLRMGLRALVVDRDGRGYDKDSWHEARTFRIGEQEQLLIADNQTDMYREADAALKQELTRRAWGVDCLTNEGASLHD